MAPRQVLDRVWLVGSGTDGVAGTDPHDCHCYLVWDGVGGFLVDAGTGLAARRWLDNVADVCDPGRLGGVLLTHYHADHAGGAAGAAQAGLTVLGHPVTAAAVTAGDEARTQVALAREVGVYPRDYRLRAAPVAPLHPGQRLSSGGVVIDVLDAPGHCDGHVVFTTELTEGRALFSGDCLFAGARIGMQAIPDCRLDLYRTTLMSLAGLQPDVLLPGHGEHVLGGAAEQVSRAARSFRVLVPPLNFLVPE